MKNTMKRWEMDANGRDRLVLKDVPVPTPGRGEVLVKIEAIALNHRDKMVIENGRGLPMVFPFTPGSDACGTVLECGDGAALFACGDRVISTFTPGWLDGLRQGNARTPSYRTLGGFYPGVLAEYVAFPEAWFVRSPISLDAAEASTLPCAGLTAWFALVERGHVRAGERVLVEGTGGVAMFGVQIAKAHGAEVIISASANKLGRAKEHGADQGIDRRRKDWVEAVLDMTGDHGADHILELIGGPHLDHAIRVAAVGGRIYQIGALEGFEISASLMPLLLKDITIHGIGTGHRRALEDLVAGIDRTLIKPIIDARYTLSNLPAALDHLDRGAFGKIVVEIE